MDGQNQPTPMKILGFCILHYGVTYFREAIASIYDQVDRIVVLYTDHPSQGFGGDLPCPDSQDDLKRCIQGFEDKIQWVQDRWCYEGEHVNAVFNHAAGYDWLWRFDSDEVAPPGIVAEMVSQAVQSNHNHYGVPFIHHWKSFSKVCRDGQMPMRLIRVNGGEGQRYLDSRDGKFVVNHMGYCQEDKYIRYKLQCSGHKPEFRPEWYTEKWLANAQHDVHPVCTQGFWNPEHFDKERMPQVLKDHRYFNVDVIN
jgi:hypothetical protein